MRVGYGQPTFSSVNTDTTSTKTIAIKDEVITRASLIVIRLFFVQLTLLIITMSDNLMTVSVSSDDRHSLKRPLSFTPFHSICKTLFLIFSNVTFYLLPVSGKSE
jgi:hypothetical protein